MTAKVWDCAGLAHDKHLHVCFNARQAASKGAAGSGSSGSSGGGGPLWRACLQHRMVCAPGDTHEDDVDLRDLIAGAARVATGIPGSWHVLTEEEWASSGLYVARVCRRGWHGIIRHLLFMPASNRFVVLEDRIRNEPTIDAAHELAKKAASRLTYRLDTSSAIEFDLDDVSAGGSGGGPATACTSDVPLPLPSAPP